MFELQAKFPVGVAVFVFLCVVDWKPVQGVPCFLTKACWVKIQPDLYRRRGLENGFMVITVLFYTTTASRDTGKTQINIV